MASDVGSQIADRLTRPRPCDERGMELGEYKRPAWTPLGFLRRGDRYILTCQSCGEAQDAPLQALVDRGDGDRPWHLFKWTWPACGARAIKVSLELNPTWR